MLQDPAKTLRFAFGEADPRAITAVSVWSLAPGGLPPAAAAAAIVSIGTAGSVSTCYALPASPDPARPGWAASQLLCGAAGDTAWLHFPGAAGPLAVRMCTAAAAGGAPPGANLTFPYP
jgi:hypothetical protein